MGPLTKNIPSQDEGFSWARNSLLTLLVAAFLLPVAQSIFQIFSEESSLDSLSADFFLLVLRSLIWGTLMALLSAGLSIAAALPSAIFLGFSQNLGPKLQKTLRMIGLMVFSLPSSALALAFLSITPATFPLFAQRGIFPILVAHVFWNHLILVSIFQSKIKLWLGNSGSPQIDSARCLGASRSSLLKKIILPVLAPDISFFFSAIFLWSLSSFGTVLILGGGPGSGSLETLNFYHLFASFDPARLAVLLPITMVFNLAAFLFFQKYLTKFSTPSALANEHDEKNIAENATKNPFASFFPATLIPLASAFLFFVIVFNSLRGTAELISTGINSVLWAAIGNSTLVGLFSSLCIFAFSFLSCLSPSSLHRKVLWAIGISPALLSVAWGPWMRLNLSGYPHPLRLLMIGLLIGLSLWPLADFWIARRKTQIPDSLIASAGCLGASLSQRIFRIRQPYLKDALIVSGLFAFLCGFSDLLFSPLLLGDASTLALLAQEKAARYQTTYSHFFLLTLWLLLAAAFLLRNFYEKFRRVHASS